MSRKIATFCLEREHLKTQIFGSSALGEPKSNILKDGENRKVWGTPKISRLGPFFIGLAPLLQIGERTGGASKQLPFTTHYLVSCALKNLTTPKINGTQFCTIPYNHFEAYILKRRHTYLAEFLNAVINVPKYFTLWCFTQQILSRTIETAQILTFEELNKNVPIGYIKKHNVTHFIFMFTLI